MAGKQLDENIIRKAISEAPVSNILSEMTDIDKKNAVKLGKNYASVHGNKGVNKIIEIVTKEEGCSISKIKHESKLQKKLASQAAKKKIFHCLITTTGKIKYKELSYLKTSNITFKPVQCDRISPQHKNIVAWMCFSTKKNFFAKKVLGVEVYGDCLLTRFNPLTRDEINKLAESGKKAWKKIELPFSFKEHKDVKNIMDEIDTITAKEVDTIPTKEITGDKETEIKDTEIDIEDIFNNIEE